MATATLFTTTKLWIKGTILGFLLSISFLILGSIGNGEGSLYAVILAIMSIPFTMLAGVFIGYLIEYFRKKYN